MKKILFVAVVLTAFSACYKEPGIQIPRYQIDKISGFFDVEDTLRFYYDWRGRPDSVKRSYNTYSQNQMRFKYDYWGRLTDVAQYWESENWFDTWHHYTYNAQGRVEIDSTYEFGDIGPGFTPVPPPHRDRHYLRGVWKLFYDSKGRIIKQTDISVTSWDRSVEYIYDETDNLIQEIWRLPTEDFYKSYEYTEHKSFYATNPVWQFLSRDYSKNARFPVKEANAQGLPVRVEGPPPTGSANLFYGIQYYVGELNISYKKTW